MVRLFLADRRLPALTFLFACVDSNAGSSIGARRTADFDDTRGQVALTVARSREPNMPRDSRHTPPSRNATGRLASTQRIFASGAITTATLLSGCVGSRDQRPGYAYRQYDHNRPDLPYGGYDAGRYCCDNTRYRQRQMWRNDRAYRANDGRYYCRRIDGKTGLILGAIAGGIQTASDSRSSAPLRPHF